MQSLEIIDAVTVEGALETMRNVSAKPRENFPHRWPLTARGADRVDKFERQVSESGRSSVLWRREVCPGAGVHFIGTEHLAGQQAAVPLLLLGRSQIWHRLYGRGTVHGYKAKFRAAILKRIDESHARLYPSLASKCP